MKWRIFEPTRKIFFLASFIAAGSRRRYACSLFMGALPVRQRFESDGVSGVILGKALYEGTLDFREAFEYVTGGGPIRDDAEL